MSEEPGGSTPAGGPREGSGPEDDSQAAGGGGDAARHDPPTVGSGEEERDDPLAALRRRITSLDEELVRLVGERRALVLEIGRVKERLGMPVLDPAREAQVVRRAAALARAADVDEELVRDVIWRIVASARDAQEGRTGWGPEAGPGPAERPGQEEPPNREDRS